MRHWVKRSISVVSAFAVAFTMSVGLLATADIKLLDADAASYFEAAEPTKFTSLDNFKRSQISIHDTSILYDEDTDMYYAYVTNNSRIWKSPDLTDWTLLSTNRTGTGWAPSSIKLRTPINFGGTDYSYAVYDSNSDYGTRDSQIRMYLANSPEGPFVLADARVIVSEPTSIAEDYNAIDPYMIYDEDGKLWMSFGSWFGGIYIVEINQTTGLPIDITSAKRIYYRNINHSDMEGSSIVYNADTGYYYLMVSYGSLNNSYNVRIGRSATVDGPYYDYNGVPLNNTAMTTEENINIGTKITTPYYFEHEAGFYALGHGEWLYNSDTDEYFISTKSLATGVNNTPLNIRQVYFVDGWPVVSPEMYAGEVAYQTIPETDILGTYQIIPLLRSNADDNTNFQRGNDAIVLEAGGIVAGVNYSGSWSYDGTNLLTLVLNGVTYKVTVSAAWDWENWKPTLIFTGLSAAGDWKEEYAGISIWGKQVDPTPLVQGSYDALTVQSIANDDVALPASYYTGVSLTWISSNPDILAADGILVKKPDTQTFVTLEATLSLGGVTLKKEFEVLVYPEASAPNDNALANFTYDKATDPYADSVAGYDMTAAGAVTANVEGVLNTGVYLNKGTLNVPTKLAKVNNFTFATWINMSNTTSRDANLLTISNGSGKSISLTVWGSAGDNCQMRFSGTTDVTVTATANARIMATDWSYVVFTIDTGNIAKLYLNGELVATATGFYMDPADIENATITIGSSGLAATLDETSFYNRAITQEEITAFYNEMISLKNVRTTKSVIYTEVGASVASPAGVYIFPNTYSAKYGALLSYSSSNPDVASVDPVTGEISGVAVGTATITASGYGLNSVSYTVNVTAPVPATSIAITGGSATMKTFKTMALGTTVAPTRTTKQVIWSSSDPAVATVSEDGLVEALTAGVTTITASITGASGVITDTLEITVTESLIIHLDFEDEDLTNTAPGSSLVVNSGSALGKAVYEYKEGIVGNRAFTINYDAFLDDDGNKVIPSGMTGIYPYANQPISKTETEFTASVWVNSNSFANHTAVIASTNSGNRWFTLAPGGTANGGYPTFRLSNWAVNGERGTDMMDVKDPNKMNAGEWYLMTATYSVTATESASTTYSGIQKLYINGVLVDQRSDGDNPFSPTGRRDQAQDIYFGGNIWDRAFDGLMDDVRIYNVALTADQVMALYNEVYATTYDISVYHVYGDEEAVLDDAQSGTFENGTAITAAPVEITGYEYASVTVDGIPWTSNNGDITGIVDGEDITITYYYDAVPNVVDDGGDDEDNRETDTSTTPSVDKVGVSSPAATGDNVPFETLSLLLILSVGVAVLIRRRHMEK